MKKILLLVLILNQSIWSADLYLFLDNGKFNDNYAENIISKDLKIGEKIYLQDRHVIFKGLLGSGNTTIVLKVHDLKEGNDFALRLPYGNTEKDYDIFDGKRFINYTYDGYKELKEANLPIPKIYSYEKDSFLLVEIIAHDFDLKTFISTNKKIQKKEKKKIVKSLLRFVKASSRFQSIGDFHLEQLVYSREQDKWTLLDWSVKHQLARIPSSPTIFSKISFLEDINTQQSRSKKEQIEISKFEIELQQKIQQHIEKERITLAQIDTTLLEKIKLKLQHLTDHTEVLEVYKKLKALNLASSYTLLQKDFIENQLAKFPNGQLNSFELSILLEKLGTFSPFYFSQFMEKILTGVADFDTFMILYRKINTIGLDEEMEDDIAQAIMKNMERILSNSPNTSETIKKINELKSNYNIINHRTREILEKADELLRPVQNCHGIMSEILNRAN